ncbi:MAG: hypothetical protein ACLQNE_01740 [Thermoguttaceae bacterium]
MKYTILEFIGGAWDSMNLCNCSPDPIEAALADHVLKATDNGKKGKGIVMPHAYAVKSGGCNYVVTLRTDVNKESLVRLVCRDADSHEGRAVEQPRTIILRFEGGCLDGHMLRSDVEDVEEALLATAHYFITDQGAVSRSVQFPLALCRRCLSKAQCGEYHVVKRREDERSIEVIFEYTGQRG